MTDEQREDRVLARIQVVEWRRLHRDLYQRELRELRWLYATLDAIREHECSLDVPEDACEEDWRETCGL